MTARTIEICAAIKRETPGAFLVSDDDERTVWIPKSQIKTDQDCGPGDTVVFTMPEWLAVDKGFI